MVKISVCIDMMFSYCDFYKRFDVVKNCGIETVEFWKWSNKDIDKILSSGMNVSIFNIDSKNESLSYDLSRGIMNDGRKEDFAAAITESIPIYKNLSATGMIALVGENAEYCEENIVKCLEAAIPILDKYDVNILIEPLNSYDRKNYSMPYAKPVFELLRKINNPHIKMLYDIYHQNMMGDFDIEEIKKNIDLIGHFHVADAPGRHEPGTGKVDYVNILKEIEKTNYSNFIGLEYIATKRDENTLGFLKELKYV